MDRTTTKQQRPRMGQTCSSQASLGAVSFATSNTKAGFPMPEVLKESKPKEHSLYGHYEKHILSIIHWILQTPNWWESIDDDDHYDKCLKARENGSFCSYPRLDNNFEALVTYAVAECRWLLKQYPGPVRPAALSNSCVILSRNDIPGNLIQSLMQDIARLRQEGAVGSNKEDRHPREEQIVHLVHPSLYAYEQGVTKVLEGVGAESLMSPPWEVFLGADGITAHGELPKKGLVWLPSEFFVSSPTSANVRVDDQTSPKCQINSYINSLHPIEYQGLYEKIGELFVLALPLLENALAEVNDNGNVRRRKNRIRQSASMNETIPDFVEPQYTAARVPVNLHDRPLQVIVKLISLELDPDTEKSFLSGYYSGGCWHVEGTPDERIVASACCYLEFDNVNECRLGFRDGSEGSNGDKLGSCETKPGQILAWPNTLHHRVHGVYLKDRSRRGHRTICCFNLVDPTLRVRSTATVPPQQYAWLASEIDRSLNSCMSEASVRNHVIDMHQYVQDGCITYEQACDRRKRLSEERSGAEQAISNTFYELED